MERRRAHGSASLGKGALETFITGLNPRPALLYCLLVPATSGWWKVNLGVQGRLIFPEWRVQVFWWFRGILRGCRWRRWLGCDLWVPGWAFACLRAHKQRLNEAQTGSRFRFDSTWHDPVEGVLCWYCWDSGSGCAKPATEKFSTPSSCRLGFGWWFGSGVASLSDLLWIEPLLRSSSRPHGERVARPTKQFVPHQLWPAFQCHGSWQRWEEGHHRLPRKWLGHCVSSEFFWLCGSKAPGHCFPDTFQCSWERAHLPRLLVWRDHLQLGECWQLSIFSWLGWRWRHWHAQKEHGWQGESLGVHAMPHVDSGSVGSVLNIFLDYTFYVACNLSVMQYKKTYCRPFRHTLIEMNSPKANQQVAWAVLQVYLYEQLSNGTIYAHALPLPTARDFSAADFDRDGDVDIMIVPPNSDSCLYFERHGDGSLEQLFGTDNPFNALCKQPSGSTTTEQELFASLGDWDGDGETDLVVIDNYRVTLWKNQPMDTFVEVDEKNNPFARIGLSVPSDVTVVDVNHDGRPDVIVPPQSNLAAQWAALSGGGGYQPYTYFEHAATDLLVEQVGEANPFGKVDFNELLSTQAFLPLKASFLDIDDDGDLDLVHSELHYTRNDGNGQFTYLNRTDPHHPFLGIEDNKASCWTFVDWDKDGDLDLVQAYERGGRTLEEIRVYKAWVTQQVLEMVRNGTSRAECRAWAQKKGPQMRFYRNDGATFRELTGPDNPFHGIGPLELENSCPALVDLDKDGTLELVLGTQTGSVSLLRNFCWKILWLFVSEEALWYFFARPTLLCSKVSSSILSKRTAPFSALPKARLLTSPFKQSSAWLQSILTLWIGMVTGTPTWLSRALTKCNSFIEVFVGPHLPTASLVFATILPQSASVLLAQKGQTAPSVAISMSARRTDAGRAQATMNWQGPAVSEAGIGRKASSRHHVLNNVEVSSLNDSTCVFLPLGFGCQFSMIFLLRCCQVFVFCPFAKLVCCYCTATSN